MFPILEIAARNVAQHRRRSLLVGGAIAAVTLLLTLVLGVLHSTRARLYETATALFAGDLNVNGVYKPTLARAEPVLAGGPELAERLRQAVPEVASVIPRRIGVTTVASDTRSVDDLVAIGVDPSRETSLPRVLELTAGRFDEVSSPGGVIISEDRARQLHVGVGDALTLTALNHRKVYNAVDARVVGIAKNVSGGLMNVVVLGSLDTVGRLFGFADTELSTLQLHLRGSEGELGLVQEKVRQAVSGAGRQLLEDQKGEPWPFKKHRLENESWIGPRVDVLRWDEEAGPQAAVLTLLNALIGVVTLVLLLVTSAGLMNALFLAVRERTPEIGTLRAIGMRRNWVVRMFVAEALVLALLGTAAGVGAGLLLGALLNALAVPVPGALQVYVGMGESVRFAVDRSGVLVSSALIVVSTTLISMFPSYVASRIQPITAIQRTE